MSAYRKGKMEKINIIFPSIIKSLGIGNEFMNHLVMFYWPRIVGKHIASNVSPVKLEFKKLFLYASHPVWSTQLSYMEEEIVNKINNFMGNYLISSIVFTNIRPSKIDEDDKSPSVDIGKEIRKIDIGDEKLKKINDELSFVSDENLKKVLLKTRINNEKMKIFRIKNKWHKCKLCTSLCSPENELCDDCKRQERNKKNKKIRDFLLDMPWARYCDIVKEIPCTAEEVNEQKIILMQKIASRISHNNTDCMDMSTLVMLYKSVTPEMVNEQLRESTKKRFRFDFMDIGKNNFNKKFRKRYNSV
ncbi:MAG: DUF721 domain-containing protein [Anaerovibrio sp.]|uniref:DUF721 domain-containing protein n=1 Tax=Anaerovibrio sp. TaxID=1872532 RepID=UPI0025CCBC70|nr:DUF721 domain-containing protein [Anaerovibrio sp.]MCR5176070.1 DUF721 domain-containing protein [Anaerovibrio sp.]